MILWMFLWLVQSGAGLILKVSELFKPTETKRDQNNLGLKITQALLAALVLILIQNMQINSFNPHTSSCHSGASH